jgi:hypothetical protein
MNCAREAITTWTLHWPDDQDYAEAALAGTPPPLVVIKNDPPDLYKAAVWNGEERLIINWLSAEAVRNGWRNDDIVGVIKGGTDTQKLTVMGAVNRARVDYKDPWNPRANRWRR